MKKVIYTPTRYFPSISGAEFYFQRMAEILTKDKDVIIDIFTSDAIDFKALRSNKGRTIREGDKYYDQVNKLVIRRFHTTYDMSIKEQINYLSNIKEFKDLHLSEETVKEILKNGPFLKDLIDYFMKNTNNYNLIHTTFFPYFNLIISLIIGHKLKMPTICTPFFHYANPRYFNKYTLEVLNKFDLLIACTNKEKNKLLELLNLTPDSIKIIPMGVDYEIFKDFKKKKRKQKNFKKKFFNYNQFNYKMILFCGYKNYEKGALSILKAIPIIYEKFKEVYFVFIGPPTRAFNMELSKLEHSYKSQIINLTPDNLTGYFDKYKISAFLQADIFLMPSRSDAFGIAYLEAWASDTPVIGANIGATPEVINNMFDGLLVEFDNPVDIAEKVLLLLNNKKLRKKLANNGREKVINKFHWNDVVDQTYKLYLNTVKSSERHNE